MWTLTIWPSLDLDAGNIGLLSEVSIKGGTTLIYVSTVMGTVCSWNRMLTFCVYVYHLLFYAYQLRADCVVLCIND